MKTTMKKIGAAVLMLALTYTSGFAFEDSIKVTDKNSFDLVIGKIRPGTRISFMDKHNNALYEQKIKGDSVFAKSFNVELLKKGDYSIRIEDEMRTKEIPLNIQDGGIHFDGSAIREAYKPVVHEIGDLVYVNQFSPGGDPLYIAIYDPYNNLVYEDQLKGETTLGQVYDFSKSMPGAYRFYLQSKEIAVSRQIQVGR